MVRDMGELDREGIDFAVRRMGRPLAVGSNLRNTVHHSFLFPREEDAAVVNSGSPFFWRLKDSSLNATIKTSFITLMTR